MPKVEIYTWATCPFCRQAKHLLNSKGVEFIEHAIDGDAEGSDHNDGAGARAAIATPSLHRRSPHWRLR